MAKKRHKNNGKPWSSRTNAAANGGTDKHTVERQPRFENRSDSLQQLVDNLSLIEEHDECCDRFGGATLRLKARTPIRTFETSSEGECLASRQPNVMKVLTPLFHLIIKLLLMQASIAMALPMTGYLATHNVRSTRASFVLPAFDVRLLHNIPTEKRQQTMLLANNNIDSNAITHVIDENLHENNGGNRSFPSSPLTKIPPHLVPTLDLASLMSHVATYTCTKRGREAILDLASTPSSNGSIFDKIRDGQKPSLFGNSQRRMRKDGYGGRRQSWNHSANSKISSLPPIFIAQTAEEAIAEYALVHQAMVIIRSQKSVNSAIVPLPPMFQLNDGVSNSADSDEDEWIDLCLDPPFPATDIYQEIDLEMILKAEQVVKLVLDTIDWATSERIQENMPGLVGVVRKMECSTDEAGNSGEGGNMKHLSDLYKTIKGAVEIVRAGPNLSDVENRFSYQFQLASGNGRYAELDLLRAREERLLSQQNNDDTRQLSIVREEISIVENQLKRSMIASMIRAAPDVQRAMDALARLDVIFARASFGCDWGGLIPEIGTEGRVHVEKFVHPILALDTEGFNYSEGNAMNVVPIDLILPGKGGYQTLMISGPNGGGKTLALKSFGLVAMMVKLGLPITMAKNLHESSPSVVDFFEEILVEVGDSQSISKQESTLMARLNALASLIQKMSAQSSVLIPKTPLVLLDELGGGTDPVAGSALAQSVIEKLMSISPMCKLVATTHSPQLKALSIDNERFECASVLMSNEKSPIFELSYGTTGDSFALEAARRCRPPLPDDVIDRAAELMDGGDGDAADSLRQYLLALEQERQNIREVAKETEVVWKEVSDYKNDMISKIQASRMHLSRLESRLESIFDTLKKKDTSDAFDLVGDSLEELRLLKRKVQTEEEILAEKGLRRVSDTHSFSEGETVVIIAQGEWEGYDAIVKAVHDPATITVIPVLDMFSTNEDNTEDTLILRRRDVAIYDYLDWGFSDDTYIGTGSNSKRKQSSNVLSVLSNLDTGKTKATIPKITTKMKENKANASFTSARQRKAAAAAEKQKKGKKKGKKRK